MFKKKFALLGVAVLVVCALLIPPVGAAAQSVLSVFRVADTKTITITITDLQNLITFAKNQEAAQKQTTPGADQDMSGLMEKAKSEVRTLSNAGEFKAFPVSLPTALKAETPKLSAVDPHTQTITLDTAKINTALSKLGAAATVDSSFNGTTITVSTPPAFMAEYSNVSLTATQTAAVDGPDAALNSIKTAVLSIPALSEDLRAQLMAIDPKTRDIYLPVIEGLGRTTDLGSTTGYIYTASDLAQVIGMLPDISNDKMTAELQNKNASALIWTKNGVLYCLVGEKSDSELSQIARSMR